MATAVASFFIWSLQVGLSVAASEGAGCAFVGAYNISIWLNNQYLFSIAQPAGIAQRGGQPLADPAGPRAGIFQIAQTPRNPL